MADQATSERSEAVVDAYYQAGVQGRLTDFAPYLHPDFSTTAPNYLPWGGVHAGAAFFRDQVLPNLPDVLDFGRFSYDVLFADGEQVIALVNFGLTGSDATIKISEHWTVRDGKATSIWVAYFEPQALLDKLGIAAGAPYRHRSDQGRPSREGSSAEECSGTGDSGFPQMWHYNCSRTSSNQSVCALLTSREIRLKSRPVGMPTADNFDLATVSVPDPAPGEVQVKNLWMTVDPYMRGRMVDRANRTPPIQSDKVRPEGVISTLYGWRSPFELGEVLEGGAIGEVTASNDPRLKPGDLVSTVFGWREVFNAPAGILQKLDTFGLPPQAFLGVAGMPGLTAWIGLLKIAALRPGDVVFVSAAAGAVGSVACQIAKLKGHTVIGSAGGADKCAFLKHIGVDHVIDYKTTSNLTEALLRAAPTGIDVYFENVGGDHLEAALAAANYFARFALCGMISQYNAIDLPSGPRNIMFVVGKSIRLEGFRVENHFSFMPEFQREMSGWIRERKVTWKETVEQGIENAPAAFLKLLKGENFGKMLVKLG